MDGCINTIEMKLPVRRVEGMYSMYEHMVGIYNATDNHEHLLRAHLVDMYWRLEDLLNQKNVKAGKKKQVSIKFTAVEAMAFVQLWGNEPFSMALPGAVDVTAVIADIDKIAKQPGGLYDTDR